MPRCIPLGHFRASTTKTWLRPLVHTGTCLNHILASDIILSSQSLRDFLSDIRCRPPKTTAELLKGDPHCGHPIFGSNLHTSISLRPYSWCPCVQETCWPTQRWHTRRSLSHSWHKPEYGTVSRAQQAHTKKRWACRMCHTCLVELCLSDRPTWSDEPGRRPFVPSRCPSVHPMESTPDPWLDLPSPIALPRSALGTTGPTEPLAWNRKSWVGREGKLWLKVCGAFLQTTHRWLEPKWHHIFTYWNTTPNWEPSHKKFQFVCPFVSYTPRCFTTRLQQTSINHPHPTTLGNKTQLHSTEHFLFLLTLVEVAGSLGVHSHPCMIGHAQDQHWIGPKAPGTHRYLPQSHPIDFHRPAVWLDQQPTLCDQVRLALWANRHLVTGLLLGSEGLR